MIRVDREMKIDKMVIIQVYLLNKSEVMNDFIDVRIYGFLINNKIERWWIELQGMNDQKSFLKNVNQ